MDKIMKKLFKKVKKEYKVYITKFIIILYKGFNKNNYIGQFSYWVIYLGKLPIMGILPIGELTYTPNRKIQISDSDT